MKRIVSNVTVTVSLLLAVASPALAASIRNVYFTNTEPAPGRQRYQREGQLGGNPVTSFTKGQDKKAWLVIIFGDRDAHQLSGNLKASNGKVVSVIDQKIESANLPGQARVVRHTFPLEKLAPGEYAVDFVVDGDKKGTYKFTLLPTAN